MSIAMSAEILGKCIKIKEIFLEAPQKIPIIGYQNPKTIADIVDVLRHFRTVFVLNIVGHLWTFIVERKRGYFFFNF